MRRKSERMRSAELGYRGNPLFAEMAEEKKEQFDDEQGYWNLKGEEGAEVLEI